MNRKRVVIMGAAGRDFHDFNVVFRGDPSVDVVAFTANQIPGIANRRYPPELAGPGYEAGIPIVPESELERIIRDERIDTVIFAYSDVSHEFVMHEASRVLAAGADFTLLGPVRTMLASHRQVIAVGATRTGAGKSQTTRYLAALLAERGLAPVVVRHPMPYGDLAAERVERFASYQDLDRYETTIEEREEYEPHLDAGRVVYAGVDYEAILRQAEIEADVILWDGGNNDFPFYKPNLFVVVADPLRAGDELRYHPGETNVRMADVVIINKIDSAEPAAIDAVRATIGQLNPTALIVTARSDLTLVGPPITNKRVVVVEDGPTLTHGGMTYGAGIVAARRFGAAAQVDPRPVAVGSIREVLERYPALEPLIPAMGYGPAQVAELEATLNAVDADLVLSATPIDLTRVLHLNKPITRVSYELVQVGGPSLAEIIEPIVQVALAPAMVLAGAR
jgi:predicted GTPase